MREPHVHPHLEPLPADVNEALRIDLPHERFEPIVTDEPLPPRPMDLPRRLTDEGLELLLYRTPEMDELLFDEIWHLLDSGRYRPRRLSEIQEERMSFGPESNANSKSSSDDRAAVGTTEYNELPQLKFDQPSSPDYPQPAPGYPSTYNEYFLYYTTDVEHIPLLVEHVKLIRRDHEEPPVGPPPPPPHDDEHDLAGHSDFSDSDVDEMSPEEELKQTEFQRIIYERPPAERHEPEPIYAEITHRPPPPPVAQETPPAFPKTPPPQRRPLDSLDRIYEAPYEPIAVRRQPPDLPPPLPHVHHPPHEERRPAPIVRPAGSSGGRGGEPDDLRAAAHPRLRVPQCEEDGRGVRPSTNAEERPSPPRPACIACGRIKKSPISASRPSTWRRLVLWSEKSPFGTSIRTITNADTSIRRTSTITNTCRTFITTNTPRMNTATSILRIITTATREETRSNSKRPPTSSGRPFLCAPPIASGITATLRTSSTPSRSHNWRRQPNRRFPSPAPSVGRLKRFSEQFESPILPSPLAKEPAARVQKPAPLPAVQRERPAPLRPAPAPHFRRRIDEIVRIGGEEFGVVERVGGGEGTYSVEKHSDLRRLLADHQVEDAWIDRYLRSHRRWEIPRLLGAGRSLALPLRPTARRRISLGVLLRRTRLSASAPGGLDHLHIHEAIQHHHKHPHLHHDEHLHRHRHVSPPVVPASHHTPSESSSWSVQSPTRSRSSPFVHRQWRAEEDEGNELLRNPAFLRAREHSDAFAWGSIHRHRGREVAAELQRLDSESGSKTAEEEPAVVSPPPPAHSHGGSSAARSAPVEREERRSYHHEYDAVYEDPHGHVVQHRHTHDHGYSHRSGGPPEEPVPVPVRRLGQQPPPLPSTPPPKTPPAFGQEVREERPISLAERLLTKTPSFERRQRHPSARDTPTEPPKEQPAEQRLSPFGARRRSFTAERKKWVDEEEAEDEEKTEVASINEEAEDLRRTVHGLRHVELPEERAERESAAVSDEEQENRAQFARPHLRHVESGSLRRKRRLDHDPYIRHPTEPDFEPGLHFPKRRFLTYLLRAPPFRGRPRYYNRMPDLTDGLQFMNGAPIHDELLEAIDNEHTAHVDPTALLQKMYTIDYNPLIETRTRFRSMEGHMEIPNEGHELVEPVEKPWKSLYFRIRDGRFQWFATHGADECPMGDVLLVDTKITASTSDWTFKVEGGKENANLYVRAPSNVFEKWRIALLSNSASQLIDAYVHPVRPVVPHYTQKVAFIEIGTCSVRAGIQTNKPSLPQSFFPAVACISDDSNELTVGIDALRPDVRRRGRLHRPLEDGDGTTAERVRLNQRVVEACVRKVVDDLKLQPNNFKVLLSVAQDVPATHVPALLRLLIETVGFQAATIARQPSLILFSYDVTTGVVVDLGERLHVVPVIDEYIVDSAVVSLPFGAPQIRAALRRKLENGEAASLVGNQSVVAHLALREAVKQACFVSADGSSASGKSATVDLNDTLGKRFTVDEIRQEATEGLFDPQRWGLELKGLHKIIHDVIQQSPIDSRRTLYRNIYLSGGTSLLPGLAERLELEVGKVAPPSIFVQVHGSPWRYNASYLGAQVLANTHPFEECFADKSNLDEYIKQIETEIN
ncbi:hypothetical protein M3Y99_01738700 [Aphelenchoides fujianensis]|nr:hypothetical protein M3Y99_01738700 [Aphelenchoides fujianensis]